MQELIRAGAAPDDKKAGEHLRHAADEAGKVGGADGGAPMSEREHVDAAMTK
ncbi:hypothetical protein KC362_g13692, partial [Hortaea werneckii]